MDTATEAGVDAAGAITGIAMATCHVDDYAAAYAFYNGLLGLERQFEMGPASCYFRITDNVGLYLEGGNTPAPVTPTTARTSPVFSVVSASALFEKLRAAGVRCIQEAPMDMGNDMYWFQFFDPSGNILEALGGK